MTPDDSLLAALADALARRAHQEPACDPGLPRAAVAVLLRPGEQGLELLLIRRAEREGDPWSGHVALPGGREQAEDAGPAHTAARETHEEVAIDVRRDGRMVGALEPVWPQSSRAPRIVVRPFVFAIPAHARAVPNHEVHAAVWIPLRELLHRGAVTEHLLEIDGIEPMRFPAFDARGYVVWGLTHRILTTFLEVYGEVSGERVSG
ncbi:MAG: CoA pyrophosphatase [Gemmatimonadetes bacterium]|nr:CoA pyrophosphatase [Gemmatimonadota bacterium]